MLIGVCLQALAGFEKLADAADRFGIGEAVR